MKHVTNQRPIIHRAVNEIKMDEPLKVKVNIVIRKGLMEEEFEDTKGVNRIRISKKNR